MVTSPAPLTLKPEPILTPPTALEVATGRSPDAIAAPDRTSPFAS